MAPNRDPADVHAWLVGSGVASLAAAVHLIKQAQVPPHRVHILEAHSRFGGAMQVSGNAVDGYVLHAGTLPYFHEDCVKGLLAMIPAARHPEKTAWEAVKEYEQFTRPINKSLTRAIRQSENGLRTVDMHRLQIGPKLCMGLIRFIVDSERSFESKRISEVFDEVFFESEFWALWSTTFLLQRWHSATEFHRLLIKYLPEMGTHNDVRGLERTPFSLYESIITPMTTYLKEAEVDFRFHTTVTDLKLYPDSDPTTVSEILIQENGQEKLITVDPVDIVIVTLGSMSTGMKTGTNSEPPPPSPSLSLETLEGGEWLLWRKLMQQSPKFGNPSNFIRPSESKLETFTVTLRDSDFTAFYSKLTRDKPGTGALLTLMDSPWCLNISVPHQPVFTTQPKMVHVIWGYGLYPEKRGSYVKKPMELCSGEEIFLELISHLGFPADRLLSKAITIPCMLPLGTSALLSRTRHDRPSVIPHGTTNLAFIGQYAEVPDDTSLSMEYSIRGAQIAVCNLMKLGHAPPKLGKNKLLEVLGLLL